MIVKEIFQLLLEFSCYLNKTLQKQFSFLLLHLLHCETCNNAQFWHSSPKWYKKWEWNSWLYDAQKFSYSFAIFLSLQRVFQLERVNVYSSTFTILNEKEPRVTSYISCCTVDEICLPNSKIWINQKRMGFFFFRMILNTH